MTKYQSVSGSRAEDLFIELFAEVFGEENARFLYSQYHFYDIYQNNRYADFLLEIGHKRIAFEIDDEASHNVAHVSSSKFCDDLLKQNSMIYLGWRVYRWAVRQLQNQAETVKDELRVFLGQYPHFQEIDDYLPPQRGKSLDGARLELRQHQEEALLALEEMRGRHESIALLYHATGTGKTITAISDAKRVSGRTLFIAHTKELIEQAHHAFQSVWPEVYTGRFIDTIKEATAYNICASVQSIALHLDMFKESEFDYLIIDEAHHAAAETYQAVLSYFKPKFTLGLTATPERTDDEKIILDIFKNTAHKLDIRTAVEIGALVPVRCIRIHTNIDLTKVRYNAVQYNIRDLETKIFLPERNKLIVDTWLTYVRNKRTLIFCASVQHAELIAKMLCEAGISAQSVSGTMKPAERNAFTADFASGKVMVLCACDLLNEGWDCPETEVLFMARPTMSKILYTQQLGRGMRTSAGKTCVIVFDFVDIASQYNMPLSVHRLFRLKTYHPGELALAPSGMKMAEAALYMRGEKPEAILDYPVNVSDCEVVDLFNWQHEAEGMISQIEFTRRVNVQTETIDRYIKEEKILPDLTVPISEYKILRYFKEESVQKYADMYHWTIIKDDNRKDLFIQMIRQMDMTYSYKPVFIKGMLCYADEKGRAKIDDLVMYFMAFYENRRRQGWIVEKSNSLLSRPSPSPKAVERILLQSPFKRFEDMQAIRHAKTLGFLQFDEHIWNRLSDDEKRQIECICDEKLEQYYKRRFS